MPAKRTNAAILLTIVSIILSAIVSLSILFRLRIFLFYWYIWYEGSGKSSTT
ncbi:hypothetical protein GS8_1065 [Geobacillus stearothermophilus]|uniref:Uncharacterized protein n=1 Tax=Geobacillus stearothermophilus TaxID=1422 RepID=A0ABQ7HH12_GEOSE|nr:hypothetical protein GS8_1065 [Geobacillus stearothermophilus]